MPAAGRQCAEEAAFRSLLREMKGLRVKLARKGLYRFEVHHLLAGDETLSNVQVLQIQHGSLIIAGPCRLIAFHIAALPLVRPPTAEHIRNVTATIGRVRRQAFPIS